ncbi:MAG: L-histidine N(alpha)-methyltransferase [Methylocystaceae bacterium]|nr:MAG: L-histidine N(alpha)-methyltransferase [Methylocystaceae bacterium]
MAGETARAPRPAESAVDFARDVVDGLSKPRKSLSCRFFYDARGSRLFEIITRLPDYYPTRAEAAILAANAARMIEDAREDAALVEFGSGSSRKTEILLEQAPALGAYAPIDVSDHALEDASRRLAKLFPRLAVRPIVADFCRPIRLPAEISGRRRIGFFPGSTIGNFTPAEAVGLLRSMRGALSPGGRLIVGVDLKKDVDRLLRAYNDATGVTAAFNLNLLGRINRELDGGLDLGAFDHEAVYDEREGRIEMRLVSRKDQAASIVGREFHFRRGEAIHTENSYKYTIEQFRRTARSAGWTPRRVWTDDERLFSVHELVAP